MTNPAAEKVFLQLLLRDPSYLEKVSVHYFSSQETQQIFEAIEKIYLNSQNIDAALLKEEGVEAEWLFKTPNVKIADYYNILKSNYIKRELSAYGLSLKYDTKSKTADQLILDNQALLLKLTSTIEKVDKNIVDSAINTAKEAFITRNLKGLAGISLINTQLNDLTGGLRKKQLSIIAARPSIGKTLYAANILEHHCYIDKVPSLFISLEMPAEIVGQRIICSKIGINFHALNTGYLSKIDLEKLYAPIKCNQCQSINIISKVDYDNYNARATCSKCGSDDILTALGQLHADTNMFIDDRPSLSITQILLSIKSHKIRYPELDLVIIDHLGEIGWAPGDKKVDKLGNICKMLRKIARELDIHILLLSQLNRLSDVEEREPALHDLRDSGEIEQIADLVLLLHRDKKDNPDQMNILLEKQRNGPLGKITAKLDIKIQKFFKDSVVI